MKKEEKKTKKDLPNYTHCPLAWHPSLKWFECIEDKCAWWYKYTKDGGGECCVLALARKL